MGAGAVVLSLRGVSHRFGAVLALDDASLTVRAGTVHALLGENGAGKTTLMRVAFGLLAANAGTVAVRDTLATIASPAAALALGIGMVHQHFSLVPAMTVAENVALGGRGVYSPTRAAAHARDVATRAGLVLDPLAVVSTLSVGAQQRCEIVKALARDATLLILDEPTAVLAPTEAAELLRWMRGFADAGHAVVLITHKLRDALAVADDVTVLRRGRTVLAARARDTSQDTLRTAMVGAQAGAAVAGVLQEPGTEPANRLEGTAPGTARAAVRTAVPGAASGAVPGAAVADPCREVLRATNVHYVDERGAARVRGVSMAVQAGELVGIAAVEGAGQHELLRLLAGRLQPQRGTIARPLRLGFVPEDRHRDALMLDATLFENVALRGAGARRGRIAWTPVRHNTEQIIAERDVRTDSAASLARTLSGGNQQKLVVGRELADAPDAVIAESPSRGLDFQATASVHAALREARDAGAAVVVYSSDLDEVMLLADRVFAMFNGTLTEVPRDREAIGRAILGAS